MTGYRVKKRCDECGRMENKFYKRNGKYTCWKCYRKKVIIIGGKNE